MTSQTFTASGTFTVPGGITSLEVQAWGEGGTGAGGFNGSATGGGGGGGEYAAEATLSVTGGSTLTITIGTGGTATDTTVTGGGVTVTAHAGGSASGTTAGAAGSGSSNSTHHSGGAGGAGGTGSTHTGGGGASSGGTAAAGNAGGSGASGGGAGSAVTGGGAGGAGAGINGTAGSAPGGGGGGGGNNFGSNGSGAAGAAGQVIVTYTIPPVTSTGSMALAPMALAGAAGGGSTTSTGSMALAPMALAGAESPPTANGGSALAPMGMAGTGSVLVTFPAAPLAMFVELLLNGTWTDVTTYVLGRSDIEITRGRPDETQSATPAQCKLLLANRDGRFSPGNPNGAYYPYLTRNVQLRVSVNTASATLVQYSGYRFWGEVASWALKWDPSGTDIWAEVTASGPLRRYSQGSGKIGSAMRRYYTRLSDNTAPYGYWPGEDASGADEIASAVTGVAAMGYTGGPSFSSDSGFGGSDPFPAVNGSLWHGQTAAAAHPPGTGSLTEGTPGTYTWTCPPGVTTVSVTCIGAGGGGGAAGPTAGGGGGGGGGFSSNASVPVTAGTTYTYAVPAGGTAGTTTGTQGTAGGAAVFTGDSSTVVTGGGGQPGLGGNTSTGGAGGTGTHAGGAGAAGSASQTTSGSQGVGGHSGSSGGASGGTATQASAEWIAPAGVISVSVYAGGGGGGGEGGGAFGVGYGGGGGGGGALSSGTITTSPGSVYTFKAGNGGAGGNSGQPGQAGAVSSVSGESSTSVTAGGGGAGSGSGSSGAGGTGDTAGSAGGFGVHAPTGNQGGGGGGGGGGGDNGVGGGASGRSPGGGGGNGSGGGWGASSLNGSDATTGGTGGGGNLSVGGGGGGGGGAVNQTSGKVGGGGGAGWIEWYWSYTGPVGGGGGGSAGTGGAGNAGNINGTGGSAVTGGGAGGSGGSAGASPGGGGGGGIPVSPVDSNITPPGRGAPGQVTLSWSGGTVSPVAADIIRFLLDVQSSGGTQPSYSFTILNSSQTFTATGSAYANDTPVQLSGGSLPSGFSAATTYYVVSASGATFGLSATKGGSAIVASSSGSGNVQSVAGWVVARAVTYGTVEQLDVVYNTGGGLELIGYSSGGSVLFDSGNQAFGLNGTPVMVSAELTANTTGGAVWKLTAIEPNGVAAIATYTGTVTSVGVGYVSDYFISPDSDVTFASVGQMTVQTYAPDITVMAPVIAGYAGELAADRLARLAAEESLALRPDRQYHGHPADGRAGRRHAHQRPASLRGSRPRAAVRTPRSVRDRLPDQGEPARAEPGPDPGLFPRPTRRGTPAPRRRPVHPQRHHHHQAERVQCHRRAVDRGYVASGAPERGRGLHLHPDRLRLRRHAAAEPRRMDADHRDRAGRPL